MSWWMFLPTLWLATATNLAFLPGLSIWCPPDALILLWSLVVVRCETRHMLPQCWLVGLLIGLSSDLTPGIAAGVAVFLAWVRLQLRSERGDDSLGWGVWGLPFMGGLIGLSYVAELAFRRETIDLIEIGLHSFKIAIGSYLMGIVLLLLRTIIVRLFAQRAADFAFDSRSNSFFLSR